ncbi:MAG: hypothetical protein WBP94_14340 [Rhodomicrobiaceae bacterium]
MPDINQIQFTHKELLEMLLKQAHVHEGKWVLMARFGIAPGNYGPSPDQIVPGALFTVTHMGILRATDDTPEGMWMDASIVNPDTKKG